MSQLENALRICVNAHHGQKDKAGQPYALHPLRMMFRLSNDEEKVVALLHDVVEDTEYSLEDLEQAGFSEDVIAGVDALTRRPDETYDEFVERCQQNPLARVVKIADLEDNMDPTRLAEFTEHDLVRLQRYHRSWRKLTSPF